MLTIKDVKSNDFSYFESLSNGQQVSSVKTAFRYIVNLSNLSGTYIDDWDIENVFKVDGRWLTDKADINKAFFGRRDIAPTVIPGITPEIAKMLEISLKDLTTGNVRSIKTSIDTKVSEISGFFTSIHRRNLELKDLRHRLELAEIAAKTKSKTVLSTVEKILVNLPLDLWDVTSSTVSFICKTDTIVPYRSIGNRINREYNLGRLILTIQTSDLKLIVQRQDFINRWTRKSFAHFHYGSYFCPGGFDSDMKTATLAGDLYGLVEMFCKWKDTYDPSSALTSATYFNHHPAFTVYHDGDWLYGMSETELVKATNDNNLFYCEPMRNYPEFRAKHALESSSFTVDSYNFMPLGGPQIGTKYERECPLSGRESRYHSSNPPLLYDEHREWLQLQIERGKFKFSNYDNGDIAPEPDCECHDPLFIDTESHQFLSRVEFINEFGCGPEEFSSQDREDS